MHANEILHTHTERRRGGGLCICVAGELDMYTAPELRRAVRHARAAGASCIELDLNELTFVDVRGAHELQASFCPLTRIRPEVRRILDLTFAQSVAV